MKCKNCNNEAHAHYGWGSGTIPSQRANLCWEHGEELSKMISGSMIRGDGWLVLDKPLEGFDGKTA